MDYTHQPEPRCFCVVQDYAQPPRRWFSLWRLLGPAVKGTVFFFWLPGNSRCEFFRVSDAGLKPVSLYRKIASLTVKGKVSRDFRQFCFFFSNVQVLANQKTRLSFNKFWWHEITKIRLPYSLNMRSQSIFRSKDPQLFFSFPVIIYLRLTFLGFPNKLTVYVGI